MLCSSTFLMLLGVLAQNHKIGKRRAILEMIPVIIGLKPAVDAYRVVGDAKRQEGQLFDSLFEMIITKTIEMFAEAIPGVIIQLSAITSTTESTSRAAYVSLAVSALTTGFTSATISFDVDTDQVQRKNNPDFFGYVPENIKKRAGKSSETS